MALSDKISNQSFNVVTHRPQEPETPTKLINMPCSQVVARKRPSLMHATFEYNIQSSQQNKVTYSKVRRVDNVLLDMISIFESPIQLMSLLAKQYPSQIAVATSAMSQFDTFKKDRLDLE
ncbi:hypothetical protein G6F38_003451 [Rhizopus arrhizus]|nr:hypothetical protein G6F38_003451 [Rhizopus arrhizus]